MAIAIKSPIILYYSKVSLNPSLSTRLSSFIGLPSTSARAIMAHYFVDVLNKTGILFRPIPQIAFHLQFLLRGIGSTGAFVYLSAKPDKGR